MKVDIFVPCCIDQFFPETAWNAVKLLEYLGLEVNYNPARSCCGRFDYSSGHAAKARQLGEKLIDSFPGNNAIVSLSASCAAMIKKHYPKMFHNSSRHIEVQRLKNRVIELTDFLVNDLGIESISPRFEHKVSLHYSCSALRDYGQGREPEVLLRNVRGLEIIDIPDNSDCCGNGGALPISMPHIAEAMTEVKVRKALEAGASYIASTETQCLMHMNKYIERHQIPLKTIHIVDILASNL